MTQGADIQDQEQPQQEELQSEPQRARGGLGWRKYALGLPLGIVGAAAALLVGLDTPIGHRLIADIIAANELDNGLRVSIGRIEGSIYGRARLSGIVLRDTHGIFLRAGEGVFDWRPINWFSSGLDIREVVLRRATLQRVPAFRATAADAKLWPDFDVRLDRVALEKLVIAKPVLGVERRIDAQGSLRVAKGLAAIRLNGRLGGEDRLSLVLDAQRAQDRFALSLDYNAPKNGLLAALTRSRAAREVRAEGRGSWKVWSGWAKAQQDGRNAVAVNFANSEGAVRFDGKLWSDPVLSEGQRHTLGGGVIALAGKGVVADRRFTGDLSARAPNLSAQGKGVLDLRRQIFVDWVLNLKGGPSLPLGKDDEFAGLEARALMNGAFAAPRAHIVARTLRWRSQTTVFEGMTADGNLRREGARWVLPVQLTAAQIRTKDGTFDPELHHVRAAGTLALEGMRLTSADVALAIPHGTARASLNADLARGDWVVQGKAGLHGWPLSLGPADAQGQVRVSGARGAPWRVAADVTGGIAQLSSHSLENLTGGALRFAGHVDVAQGNHLAVTRGRIDAPSLQMALEGGRGDDGRIALNARGQQERYGSFAGELSIGEDGPRGQVRLQDPLPTLGVKDVLVVLTPEAEALKIEARGNSSVGPFTGTAGLIVPKGEGRTRLELRDFLLSSTHVTGSVMLDDEGADGHLTVSGGGVAGLIALAPRGGGQSVDASLDARNAHFEGERPLTIASGRLKVSGQLLKQHTTLSADLFAQGIGKGKLFIGRLGLAARLNDGNGTVNATMGGRKGSRFDLQVSSDIAPGKVSVLAGGSFAGQKIAMPRRALFTVESRDGAPGVWRLAPSQIDFGGGRVVAQGLIGNGSTELDLGLVSMPLSLADVVVPDIGLGGKVSGKLTYVQRREALPEGEARVIVKGLTRSGLMLTSRPVDVAVVTRLGARALDLRAVASEGGAARGRLQARIDQLADTGALTERLGAGRLAAQMRYAGPADALWRLMALDAFDLSGPVEIAADMSGTLDDPSIRGSLAGKGMRLQSAASGTDIGNVDVKGDFDGSALSLSTLSGVAPGGGLVTGSGRVDFAQMGPGRGPSIDVALAARRAQLISRPDMALSASGPIRIMSDGMTGTIAGRLSIDSARWRLGQASSAADLPSLPTREINRRADIAPATERDMPWRLMVDASGGNIRLSGLGLNSLWNADLKLRGALQEPAINGAATLVEGSYDFASKHFDLTRGRISFDGSTPVDPRLDMAATATVNNLTATVTVRGTSLRPEIAFSSVPALPEEELLSRILFGDSITQISAPEALQLGAALAALHGGGGLDPINKLRSVIGLDRLRFVSADATIGRQTGVAVGKYLGRHIYAEIVTDGRGYSATNVEFRLTSWLALLGTVASTGRQSVNAKVSKDY